uniref:Leucine-rich repeat-containing protein 51 n=1 Tax=Steinernema glaseri TaxID=37863 RepID=A0A1I8ATF0_9BILA
MALSAARGVTQVMNRCEDAKTSGFLDLSNCSLMYIADAIYLVLKGHSITKCSLKNNSLKKFPKKMIDRFPEMMIFNMEGNALEEAPEELGEWVSMKGINLAHNKLTRFPEQLYAMKQLSLLDLSGNPIEDLDPKP